MLSLKRCLSGAIALLMVCSCTGCSSESIATTTHTASKSSASSALRPEAAVSGQTASDAEINLHGGNAGQSNSPSPTLLNSSVEPSYHYVDSYYVQYLSQSNKRVYSDLKDGIRDCQTEITLSQPCSQSDFQRIMNILYFDTPELFHLKPFYKEEINDVGNVFALKPQYFFSKDQYIDEKTKIENSIQEKIISAKSKNLTDVQFENQVTSYFLSRNFLITKDNQPSSNTKALVDSSYNLFSDNPASSLGIAKSISLFCKEAGIQCPVILGELIDSDNFMKVTKTNITSFKNIEYKQSANKTNAKELSVEIHANDMYAWNMIFLNNKWYHVDLPFSSYSRAISAGTYSWGLNLPDSLISKTHLFHWNDDILGLSPAAPNFSYYSPTCMSDSETANFNYFVSVDSVKQLPSLIQTVSKKITTTNIDNVHIIFGAQNSDVFKQIQKYFADNQKTSNALTQEYVFTQKAYPDLLLFSLSKFYRH